MSWRSSDDTSGIFYYDVDVLYASTWTNYSMDLFPFMQLRGLDDGTYAVTVKAFDNAGNENFATVSFIVDTKTPAIIQSSPSGNDVSVGSKVTVVFSENMDPRWVSVLINGVSGNLSEINGKEWTFTPVSSLAYGTGYMVTVSGKDLAGNEMSSSWNFTTLKNEGFDRRYRPRSER